MVGRLNVPPLAEALAARLMTVPGVRGVVLGGSVAAGNAAPGSDLDLGLLYGAAQPPDPAALNALCRELDDAHTAQASAPGGWGPWVDGGAWLTVGGRRVDFIYREVGRVRRSVADALAGRVVLHAQPGHPQGIHAHHYAAELAVGRLLRDPGGALAALRAQLDPYPPALADALESHYRWMKGFWLDAAHKGLGRADLAYALACAAQAAFSLAQERAARGGVWLLNEKGALLRACGPDVQARVNAALCPLDLAALREVLEAQP